MNNVQQLKKIGLSDKEAEIYVYLLKTSKDSANTAFEIAKNTKIPRSTVYLTIESLVKRKAVSSFVKNNVLHYLAENPKVFRTDLEEKQELLAGLIPSLNSLREDLLINPSVKSYSGAEGVRIVFDDIYDDPHKKGIREFHTISDPNLVEYLPKYLPKLLEYKKKINIFTKLLAPAEAGVNPREAYIPDSHREVRLLPNGFYIPGTIVVYGNKVAMLGLKKNEVYSLIIESPVIAQMMDSLFLCIWQLSKNK